MRVLEHAYFGILDTRELESVDICWKGQHQFGDSAFESWLWADERPLDIAKLDVLAKVLQDLPAVDAKAREQLRNYLRNSRDYIDDHAELSESAAIIAARDKDGVMDVDRFVAQMQISAISLWHTHVVTWAAVLDYMIDSKRSDQILAVKLAWEGHMQVLWESQ